MLVKFLVSTVTLTCMSHVCEDKNKPKVNTRTTVETSVGQEVQVTENIKVNTRVDARKVFEH